ncbi:MAG: SDR family oxidoreductase [Candidatus Gracilibacteria bacterium]|nr:SDR family oxidoreductase [Candidatus Gracilibacteria bacterium]
MGKTIVVTGASSGIGKAIALYFAEKGWHVAATMRNLSKAKDLKKVDGLKVYKLDVTNEATLKKAVKDILKDFKQIDVLVNNAGYGVGGSLESLSKEELQQQFEVNVFGLLRTTQEVIPVMRKQKKGVIVNIASVAGQMGFPFLGAYAATKHAVEAISENMVFELSQFGIVTKVVEPGAISTNFGYAMDWAKKDFDKKSPYYKQAKAWNQNMTHMFDKATPSVEVAKVVEKAIKDGAKKGFRYSVGPDAKKLLKAKKRKNDVAFLKMMMKMYG